MGKSPETVEVPKVLLIGDTDDYLLQSLLKNESVSMRQKNEMILDTKYYTARVKLESLKTEEEIQQWNASTANTDVDAVIYNYESKFRCPKQLRMQMLAWHAEIQVAVCKRLEHSAEWSEDLRRLCASERIELIELDPDKETIEELKECCELYGISRIRQVLEAGNWCDKVLKKNPLGMKKQHHCLESNLSSARSAKKSSEESFEEEEEFGCSDITEEDIEMIVKLFGVPKVSFESLMKDADSPDPAVIEYFKQETEKVRRQNKIAAKKRKKKKSKAGAANEFGEFVAAGSLTQTSSSAVTQGSSNISSPGNGQIDANARHQENIMGNMPQNSNDNKTKDSQGSPRENFELSDVARSMIDELFDANIAEQGAGREVTNMASKIDKVRSALSRMPFGPGRQNLAADAMENMIKSLGVEDLLSGSSDDEKHGEI